MESAVDFLRRARNLPHLGLGVSTEYGAGQSIGALDVLGLRRVYPSYAGFLEVGLETVKGLDEQARAWIDSGGATTYHFLDVNLDDPSSFDEGWLDDVRSLISECRPAWLCGDAGLWHLGRRDPAAMMLLPPLLRSDAALALARGIAHLRSSTGLEVLPENPPGHQFVGDLSLLEFYAEVLEAADTGMVLDCAHLAIYQCFMQRPPLEGLSSFPLERVVELHVAGGMRGQHLGRDYIEDDHRPTVLDETGAILEFVVPRAPNLKAVVFECERNPLDDCLDGFARIASVLRHNGFALGHEERR